ncbi:hypothetical protein ScalyP_jg9585 [Parmales sp. scaly parma]|nr:hypothetical protein ScalyP_jg9585 [Parmales sp. scaly parma]
MLEKIANGVVRQFAGLYQARVAVALNSYGLKYEDCLIENKATVEAISLADEETKVGRNRRIKRAMDLSYKKKSLQDYAPHLKLEPLDSTLRPDINAIKKRDEEYQVINGGW